MTLPFENGERELLAFPQKRPLIVLTSRPPQLEAPFAVFNRRCDHATMHFRSLPLERHPDSVDPRSYRPARGREVAALLELSLDEIKRLADPVDLICRGHRRERLFQMKTQIPWIAASNP